jgi:oligopeptide transport system permease protein
MLFAIPGLGSQFITSISDRDYTMVVGLALFYGILLIVMNALMDFGITMVDPRMREKA